MTYSAAWQNGNEQGRLEPAVHVVNLADAAQVADRINRRRMLVYQPRQDFGAHVHAGAYVRGSTLSAAVSPPFDSFRANITDTVIAPQVGVLGGDPATPSAMDWLWPVNDADEGKILVAGELPPGEGQVGLLAKLNGTNHWTDPSLTPGGTHVRALHFNELRQSIEWIHRGRWRMPIYLPAGIFSALPDTRWIGQAVANNGAADLRSLGFAIISTPDSPALGLANVSVRSGSFLAITTDRECTIEARRCLRQIAWQSDGPTWNKYAPDANKAWASPGALGDGDSTSIGSVALQADQPGQISGGALASALQAMIEGGEPNFLLRRTDTGPLTVNVTADVTIEFDLNPDQ